MTVQDQGRPSIDVMFENAFSGQYRPLPSGLNWEPEMVKDYVDVLLAQADTLKRLGQERPFKVKLLWAMSVATDCFETHRKSASAVLDIARIARHAGGLDFAEKMLGLADTLNGSEATKSNILYERNQIIRERDVAGGSITAMMSRLIVYCCQRCGKLIEFLAVPCMHCGWRSNTLLEISHSGCLMTPRCDVWKLFFIGRGIQAGRKATDVVPNLAEVAASELADPNSWFPGWAKGVLQRISENQDSYFCYPDVSKCDGCGTRISRPDVQSCGNCKQPVHFPPPLRLLICLERLLIHFQYNFEAPKSSEYDLFIRFLVSLQSKLYRNQDTPSDRERKQVLEMMTKWKQFDVVNGLGRILLENPSKIEVRLGPDVPASNKIAAYKYCSISPTH